MTCVNCWNRAWRSAGSVAARLALLTYALGVALPVQAGHYGPPSYSGGTLTMVPCPTVAYFMQQGGYGAGGGTGGANTSTTCSGQITATFQWIPDGPGDNPPAKVIVKETCTATWSGTNFGTPHGSCDNGLGFPETDGPGPGGPPGSTSITGTSTGTCYTVQDGQQTITLHCSPSAWASDNVVTNYSSVLYSASIILQGAALTTPDPKVIPTKNSPANKCVYNDASPGVLGNPAWVITFVNADPNNYLNSTSFISFDIGTSVKTSGPKTVAGSTITQQFTYTGLPANNDAFGDKQVTGQVGGGIAMTSIANVQVFFPKNATNHPLPDLPIAPLWYNATVTPNWYYYWSQTSANYGTHYYGGNAGGSTGVTYFDKPGNTGFATPKNAWVSLIFDQASLTSAAGTWNGAEGIDFFANMCRHEEQHRLDNIDLWGANSDVRPAEDSDGDRFPDARKPTYVPGHPYDPNNPATYPDTFHYGVNPLPDKEDLALRRQPAWTNGTADRQDWARPGHQWP